MIQTGHPAIVALAFVAFVANAPQVQSYDSADDRPAQVDTNVDSLTRYGKLPITFEPSIDAADGSQRWIGRVGRHGIAIDAHGFVVASLASGDPTATIIRRFAFVDAHSSAHVEGVGPRPTRVHHIHGNADARHDVDRPTFDAVRIAGAYAGIDVVFHGHDGRLEYDVVVQPGADPGAFGLRLETATARLDDAGNLLLADAGGDVELHRPVAYQLRGTAKAPVDSEFAIAPNGDVRFRVGAYDKTRALIIDPVVSYATYLGGNSFDQGTAIAVDGAGNAYVAGYTLSSDFPTASAFDRSIGKSADVDVFVSKLNAAGTALVWSTYLGGAGIVDRAVGVAVDAAGSAYVTGYTGGNNFPVSATAWQKPVTGGAAFIAKLAPNGSTLSYSTYVSGVTTDAIAVDRSGNAYVAGTATQRFVATPSALQPQPGNASTGFVLKLNPTGTAPVYATFLGGSGSDEATAIAVDAAGNAFVGGWTASNDFPVINAIQAQPRGQKDAFVAKLDPAGSRLIYATRLGGTLDDAINAVAIDGAGNAYVAGETYSSDFPVKGGFQTIKAGAHLINSSTGSAFVAKLLPGGNALAYSSFLGGEVCQTLCQVALGALPQYRADAAYGIAVDAAGHAYVTGIARSYTFPLVDSTSARKTDDTDDSAFVAKVGVSGGALLWSTFVRTGFNEADNKWTRFPPGAATGIAVDATGAAYVTGDADGFSDFRAGAGAFQATTSDRQGAIVVKFAAAPTMTLATSNPSVDAQAPVGLTATLAGGAIAGDVVFFDGDTSLGSAPLAANRATFVTTLPIGIHALSAMLRIPGVSVDTPVVQQVVDVPLACN